jgi:hypothetical protein
MADDRSCPSCGARVYADADQCKLCGTPIDVAEEAPPPSPEAAEGAPSEDDQEAPDPPDAEAPDGGAPASGEAAYCPQCGAEVASGANYCSQCGSELPSAAEASATRSVAADLPTGADADEPSTSTEETEADAAPATLGTQLVWMIGAGLLVVVGFFFVTQWSQQYEWGEADSGAAAPSTASSASEARPEGAPSSAPGGGGASTAEPRALSALVDALGTSVDGPVAAKIDSLRAVEQRATGDEQRQVRAELVQMYIGAGAPGRAALAQRQVADATGDVSDRRRAADLLYRWMRRVEQQKGRAEVADVARHVATAYEAVVEQRADDLDARTRMGEAYLLTNNPMKGIQTINNVLADDSTFVPARFQKGLALLQINRLDQAVEQFQTVKKYADEQDAFYQQATRAIEVIREQAGSSQGEGS